MALRLRVVSAHSRGLGETASKVFGVHGGTVGRAEDNDWVLPDPDRYVSGHHVRIEYRQGEYWVTDTSSNGTYVNESHEPLSHQGPCALHDGDRLRIGDYELIATIDAANDFPPDNSAIIAYDGIPSSSAQRRVTDGDIGADLDVDSLLGPDVSGSRITPVNAWGQAVESAAVASRRKTDAAPARPPEPRPKIEETPEAPSWHLSTRRVEPFRNPLKTPESAPAAEAAGADTAASANSQGVQALLRGAGIDPATLPPAVQAQALQVAGQLLREMVLGLMDVLHARSEVKNRFRIPEAAAQPQSGSEYNPLQFSAGVDEALRKLFEAQNKTSSRYLSPLEAVRESFQDLKVHQQAMLAAMQTAFMEFLGHLDPSELQERFDRGLKRGGLFGATNKLKYWELYAEFYQTLSQKQDLPHLFVEEFAQAYTTRIAEAAAKRPRTTKAS